MTDDNQTTDDTTTDAAATGADEAGQQEQQENKTPERSVEEQLAHWKAQARANEAKAKANREAAEKWAEHSKTVTPDIKTLQEKLAKYEQAEAEANQLNEIKELVKAAGLPESSLPFFKGRSLDEMEDLLTAGKALFGANKTDVGTRGGEAVTPEPKTPQSFAAAAKELGITLNHTI